MRSSMPEKAPIRAHLLFLFSTINKGDLIPFPEAVRPYLFQHVR
jgi:hypothetical protein